MVKYKWRLYADEDIEREIVENLRSTGFDVLWVKERKSLHGRDDLFHFRKAGQLQRYLLTKDQDFWSASPFLLHQSPGIIILSTQDTDIGSLLVWLLRDLLEDFSDPNDPIYLDNVKVKLSDQGISIKFVDQATHKKEIYREKWHELGIDLQTI